MKKYFLVALFLTTVLFSCKKSSTSCTLSSTSIIGKYKLTDVKFTPAGTSSSTDVYNFVVASCDQDNIIEFKAGGVVTTTDTGTPMVCSPASDATGTWSLNGSELSNTQYSGTVIDFSCTGFSISSTTASGNTQGTTVAVLTRQ